MVRLLRNEEMSVSNSVIDKIRIEEKKHYFKEFGGYLIVDKRGCVNDVVFDMDSQSSGDVDLGAKVIVSLPLKKRNMVRGWFHKHPITGLSSTDTRTIDQLTDFWGECYTMVLQSNGKMLLVKTIYKDPELIKKENMPEEKEEVIEVDNEDKEEKDDKKDKEIEPVDIKPLTMCQTVTRLLLGPSKPRKFKKNTYVQVSHTNPWWGSGWKNSEEVFNEEIPFGRTDFKPTFTDEIKKFKLWYPKLGGITAQYTIPQLMSLREVPFLLSHKTVVLDKEKVSELLLKGRIETLQCSGYVDMNGRALYEGDNVKYTTSWKDGSGLLKFKEGEWTLENKTMLYCDKQVLSGDIAIEFLNNKGGVRVD